MIIYCTYLTTYSGSLMPTWYIGSTSVDKINKGYRGSVQSKKYSKIWKQELREQPELFKIDIIKIFETRKEALQNEYDYQVACGVVKSPYYINESLANINGFYGMNNSGNNHPSFGKKRSLKTIENMGKNKNRIWITNNIINKMIKLDELDFFINNGFYKGVSDKTKNNYTKANKGKNKGIPKSELHKQNMRKPKTEDHKEKLRLAALNQWNKIKLLKLTPSIPVLVMPFENAP